MSKPDYGTRLKRLREKVRLSQEVIARALDIPRSAVTGIEDGSREISAGELITLCRIYRVSPNEILNWYDSTDDIGAKP